MLLFFDDSYRFFLVRSKKHFLTNVPGIAWLAWYSLTVCFLSKNDLNVTFLACFFFSLREYFVISGAVVCLGSIGSNEDDFRGGEEDPLETGEGRSSRRKSKLIESNL